MPDTLLFLHGWASGPEIWNKQREYFKECNVLTPELDLNNLKEISDKIYSLCKGEDSLIVVAWSMGWLTALKMLEYAQLNIKAMVSICGTAKFVSDDYIKDGVSASELRALRIGLRRDFISVLNNFYKRNQIPLDAGNLHTKKDLYIKQLDILEKEDLRINLKLIKCPTLFISADNDVLCPTAVQNYMSNSVTGSSVQVITDAGHAPFIRKHKEVNQLLDEFTNRTTKVL